MSIDKIPNSYVNNNATWTPLKTTAKKVNEIIDIVNGITDGEYDFTNVEISDTLTVDTINEYTAANGVAIDGLLIKDSKLSPTIGTITQDTSIVTGVILNTPFGIITTVSSTLAASSYTGFTLTNSTILSTSIILVSIVGYQGDGIPSITVHTAFDGSVALRLNNSHATEALSQPIKIAYQVI